MLLSHRYQKQSPVALQLSLAQRALRDRIRHDMESGDYTSEHVDCFCGDSGGRVLAEKDRYGLPVKTILCMECGLLRSSPRLTEEATKRFYEEDYRLLYTGDGEDPENLFAGQVERGKQIFRRFEKVFQNVESVVEVGCGAGGQLMAFAEQGKHVAGVDLGSEYLDVGRSHGLDLIPGDALTLLEHLGEPVDAILITHVLEHFLDLRQEIAKLSALLKPNGVMLLEVPGIHMIEKGYQHDFLRYLQNAHNYHFTAATFEYVLGSCGFDVCYTDESVTALVVKNPQEVDPALIQRPSGEHAKIMRYLQEQELIAMAA